MVFTVMVALLVMQRLAAQPAAESISLWPGPVPVAARQLGQEPGQEQEQGGRVRNVRDPALIAYLLPATRPAVPRPAVLVFPGGGYGHLALRKEGEAAARWANSMGMHAFIVKYRLFQFGAPAPVMDAQQALRLVRARAVEWQVDVGRVGVLGFSAGGHVAASVSQHFAHDFFAELEPPALPTPQARLSARPDFAILVYPVITLEDPFTHRGSRAGLLGDTPSPAAVAFYSLEQQVSSASPPTLLIHSSADPLVPVENSIGYWQALRAAGVATELLAYQFGGHGFGLEHDNFHTAHWPLRAQEWLRANGFLTTPAGSEPTAPAAPRGAPTPGTDRSHAVAP